MLAMLDRVNVETNLHMILGLRGFPNQGLCDRFKPRAAAKKQLWLCGCCSPVQPRVLKVFKHAVAVYKPPGVPFHQNETAQQLGILQLLRGSAYDGQLSPDVRLYPVHRLDAVTSGVVLFATSVESARTLIHCFRKRLVHKYYVALSQRAPSKKQGHVIGDMIRSRRSSWKLLRTAENPAVTKFWSTSLGNVRAGLRLYILKPETGRTHQLRVAMKSLGAPILGDMQYASSLVAANEDRTYLHSVAVRVQLDDEIVQVVCHPADGELFGNQLILEKLRGLLPASLENDTGCWFADNKLLRSHIAPQ